MINEIDIRKFYKFFNHSNPTEIRVFDEVKYPDGKSIFVKNEEEFIESCKKYDKEKVDVYIGGRDRIAKRDKNVVSSDFIFIEIDEHNIKKPELKEKIEKFLKENNIEISMCGFSGGGYHFYIPHSIKDLTQERQAEIYKKVLVAFKKALGEQGFDIDKAVFNFERVSRVLGTYNFKRKQLSQITTYNLNVDRVKNHEAIKTLILKYEEKENEVNESAVELLKKYHINKTDKWLFDLIEKGIKIREDTGGNSIVFKTSAIILTRENIPGEELRVIAKAIADLCEGRTLTALYGWITKAQNNELAKVNQIEIDNFIENENYPLRKYKDLVEDSQEEGTELNLKQFDYFKKLKKPKNDLVEKLVPPKTLSVVYSPPKCMKSLFELSKCIALSSGKLFLNEFKTKRSNCLYIDLENNEFIIKDRWEKLRKAQKIFKVKTGLYYIGRGERVDILSLGFKILIERAIEKYKIKYIVIDTLPKASNFDTNSERDVNKIYTQFLKPLIEDYNLSITFLLHTNKSGKSFIGSQAYLGIVDCSYEFVKQGKNKVRVFSNNRGENIDFGIEFEFLDDEIRTSVYDIEEQQQIIPKKKFVELLHMVEGLFIDDTIRLQRKEVEDRLQVLGVVIASEKDGGTYSRATLTRILKFLYDNRTLDKDEKGVYWKIK